MTRSVCGQSILSFETESPSLEPMNTDLRECFSKLRYPELDAHRLSDAPMVLTSIKVPSGVTWKMWMVCCCTERTASVSRYRYRPCEGQNSRSFVTVKQPRTTSLEAEPEQMY